jgi:drug/metabolite transporter (DMT)-like permease
LFWRRPYGLLLFPPLFWAGNLLIGRAFAAELPPFGMAFWRWIIALAVLVPFIWPEFKRNRRETLRAWPILFACGLTGFAGYPVLNYIALQTTPAATAAMLNSTLPLMVPLFAWVLTREPPSGRVVTGILVSFLGVGWIIARGELSVLTSLSIGQGELLVLLAVACYALYSVFLRYRPATLSPLLFLAGTCAAASACLLPFWLWEEANGHSIPLEPYAIGSLLFIGIFAALVANALWNRCVATLGPTLTGASFHLMAVYSAGLAALLLHEPVHTFHLVGVALILAGFSLAILPRRAAGTRPASPPVSIADFGRHDR